MYIYKINDLTKIFPWIGRKVRKYIPPKKEKINIS